MPKMNGIYFKGDAAIETGQSEFKHGDYFYEYELIEGHKKGEKVWQNRIPNNLFVITKNGTVLDIKNPESAHNFFNPSATNSTAF